MEKPERALLRRWLRTMVRTGTVGITLTAGLAVLAAQQRDGELTAVLPRDAIPAIDQPAFTPVTEATRHLNRDEIVIGLVGETERRAYSTWQLDRHEIVNDVFEDLPVAVTWCPLCGTGIVYRREVAGRTLTFGVSGMLFRDALVMYDRETDTLWSQVSGKALRGPLFGHALQPVPAVHATWADWVTLYPESQVLTKRGEFRSSYERYNRSTRELGIFGRRNTDERLAGKARILGVAMGTAAMAFPIERVREAGLVHSAVGNLPVLLVGEPSEIPVAVYDRRVDRRRLSFTPHDTDPLLLTDQETGSTWRIADGVAVEGPLRGQRLTRVVAHPAFWFGWHGFFPRSEVWSPQP